MTPEQEENQIDYKIKQRKTRIIEDINELLRLENGKTSLKVRLILIEEK